MSPFKKKPEIPWSRRKVYIASYLLQEETDRDFQIRDFLAPTQYPSRTTTDTWESVRILKVLFTLEHIGIMVKELFLDLRSLTTSDPHFSLLEKDTELFTPVPVELVRKALASLEVLDQAGIGVLPCLNKPEDNRAVRGLFSLPSLLVLRLQVNQKKLRRSLRGYLKRFDQGEVKNSEKPHFKQQFCQDVVQKLIDHIHHFQEVPLHLTLGGRSFPKEDLFHHTLELHDARAYGLLKRGKYWFPLWETLLFLEQENTFDFAWEVVIPKTYPKDIAKHFGFSELSLELSLRFTNLGRDHSMATDVIQVIEVGRTIDNNFLVYLNNNRLSPIRMNKRNKSGLLLYHLAEQGYVEISDQWEKVYEYFQHDKRFALFAQTDFVHTKLLMKDEHGDIVPVREVDISLVDPDSL